MSNMREIKIRIKSIQDTEQITKAMKLISASKLKKARQQLEHALPYFTKVKSTIADILLHSESVESRFFEKQPDQYEDNSAAQEDKDGKKADSGKKVGIIVITGDKGLAGGYNHNIIKAAEMLIEEAGNPQLFVAGVVGRNYFVKKHYDVDPDFDYPVQNPTVYRARDIAEIILGKYVYQELDEVYIVYTELVNAMRMVTRQIKLLPVNMEALKEDIGLTEETRFDDMILYEPSPAAMIEVLIPKYLKGVIYGALVEAFTSEQNARMAAMDNATSNADEILNELKLNYNRARQSAITQEISEIVGGTAVLQ
ncbi:MAG TPA: ATP synthase F1 subunit gamma [Clostridia bacterium]|nr:ATP synthase F1 subunit gamma [Clostridia bacterium]